jgi:hypothetical protein
VNRPGQLKLTSADELSGVSSVEYNLDGGGWTTYTNDTSFSRTIVVPQPGDHSIAIRGTDLAGNVSDPITKYFTVLAPVVPSPTPTRPPPPPGCTTALAYQSFVATGEPPAGGYQTSISVSWAFSGGCAPYHGTITDTYNAAGAILHHTFNITALASKLTDNFSCTQQGGTVQHQQVSFTIVFADSVGHQVSGVPTSALVC